MPTRERPTENSISADFAAPRVCPHYLSAALATGQTDVILDAFRDIRQTMLDQPFRKVCDFDLSLSDVGKILNRPVAKSVMNS